MYKYLAVALHGSVVRIALNRPEVFNAFHRDMALELQHALREAGADANVRAVLLTGEGRAFCSGQDLAEAVDPNGPGLDRILSEHYNPLVLQLRGLRKPVVVAVNGVAAGAGANLALAGDVRDAGGLDETLQALVETADHAVLVRVDLRHVDAVERRLDAERLALTGGVGDLGGVQERLGRDAAVVQARAADLALLHQCDGLAELRGAQGTCVAAAASAQDHDVEVVPRALGHCRLP